jgi:energy-coupling factor transport system substrate-specific component
MARSRLSLILISLLLLCILAGTALFNEQHFAVVGILFMAASFIPLMIRFERRKVSGRELVLLAVLASVAAVSRIPFAPIPNVQPTTFVIIVSALTLGPESGFVIGALAAIVSNLFLGQGPWTPWQMYAWGIIGLMAGMLRNIQWLNTAFGRCLFGFAAGFIFDWIMNLWYVISLGSHAHLAVILAYYAASFYFDLAHAFSNVFFLAFFGKSWIKIINRFKRKYGLLNE